MSLSISEHVYEKLRTSNGLKELAGDKIFPLSTKTSTTFPFIVFKRSGLVPNYTKDRHDTGDNCTVEVLVFDDNYFNSIKVAELVRSALENKKGEYDMFSVVSAKVLLSDEEFMSDTFIQRIIFSFETESN